MKIEDLRLEPLIPEPKSDYQCILVGDVWHLTQEQAVPPMVAKGDGAWTSCAVWATFKRGYNRRRPDCPVCLEHAVRWEAKCSRETS